MSKGSYVRNWEGGRVWRDEEGREHFVIRKTVQKKAYEIWLAVRREREANRQLDRFLEDPEGFDPRGDTSDPVLFTPALIEAYIGWCRKPKKNGRPGNTKAWAVKKKGRLAWWYAKLGERDLRKLDYARDIKALAEDAPSNKHSIESIKSFFTYLRRKGLVTPTQDPTLETLAVPRDPPAQKKKSKRMKLEDIQVILGWLADQHPRRRHRKAKAEGELYSVPEAAEYLGLLVSSVRACSERGKLPHSKEGGRLSFQQKDLDTYEEQEAFERSNICERVRLAIVVMGGTAWHVEEVARFSREGEVLPLPPTAVSQNGAQFVIACFHKGQFEHQSAVTFEVAEAAQKLLDLGGLEAMDVHRWSKKAAKATGIDFTPGKMRHTVLSYAEDQGTSLQAVSTAAGHRSTETTLKYTMRAVPPKVKRGPQTY